MRVQSERANLVSYLRVFVKFVVFLVENFIFNVSFGVCVRTNRTLRNRYLQTAYNLASLPSLYYTSWSPFTGSLWIDLHVSDIVSDKLFKQDFFLCFILKRLITIYIFVIVTAANYPPHTSAQVVISPQILSSKRTRWNLRQQLIVTRIKKLKV